MTLILRQAMTSSRHLTFYHSPQTRSTGVLTLLNELKADYELRLLFQKKEEQRKPDYLAINPLGKVPALVHDGVLITEQVAIYLYLADLYPEAELAPPIGNRLRGDYLRWMAIYGSCFEPAVVDLAMKREPAARGISPYGDWETLFNTLTTRLASGPYLLGDRFSAADVLWGAALTWMTMFKLVPETPEILAYLARVNARPAVAEARSQDAKWLAG